MAAPQQPRVREQDGDGRRGLVQAAAFASAGCGSLRRSRLLLRSQENLQPQVSHRCAQEGQRADTAVKSRKRLT